MKISINVLILVTALSLTGCVVSQQVYIDSAAMTGPMNQPPVHLTADSLQDPLKISPRFSTSNTHRITGEIRGESTINPLVRHDLTWNVPSYSVGVGLDVGFSRTASFFFGGDYGSDNQNGHWNGYIGLGLHGAGEVMAFRFDGGFTVGGIYRDVNTIVVTTTEFFGTHTDTAYFHDRGDGTVVDFFLAINMNTKVETWPANLFLHAGLVRQTLMNFTPSTWSDVYPVSTVTHASADAVYRVTFLTLTPGVAFKIADGYTVLVGGRFMTPLDMSGVSPSPTIVPFVQFDFTL